MDNNEIRELVKRVKAGMRITKVVATRSIKGRGGDTYVGFSAAWNTVQEDGGHDLVHASAEEDAANSMGAMTLQEAVVASCLLAREADLAAHRNAMAGGIISQQHCIDATMVIKSNYAKLIVQVLGDANGGDKDKE
jgi:hypothetical protein